MSFEQLSLLDFRPQKYCRGCDQLKPLIAFDRCAKHADGRATRCRQCKRARERAYRAAYPERKAARNAVELAIRQGRLQRPDRCDDCGRECLPRTQHESYGPQDRLTVDWLCQSCHHRRHAEVRRAA